MVINIAILVLTQQGSFKINQCTPGYIGCQTLDRVIDTLVDHMRFKPHVNFIGELIASHRLRR